MGFYKNNLYETNCMKTIHLPTSSTITLKTWGDGLSKGVSWACCYYWLTMPFSSAVRLSLSP